MEEKVKAYFEHPRKIIELKADDEYNLQLVFDNGEKKVYSMANQLTGVFEVLRDKTKFYKVFLDEFGNAAWNIDETVDSKVKWNNRIDICKDALYMDSTVK